MWQGRRHFGGGGGLLVLTEATFQVWQGVGHFGGVPARADGLGYMGLQVNTRVRRAVLVSWVESVRTGAHLCGASQVEGSQEKRHLPPLPFLDKVPTDLCPSVTGPKMNQ